MGKNVESEVEKIMSENNNAGTAKKRKKGLGKLKIFFIILGLIIVIFIVKGLLGGKKAAAVPVESSVLEKGHIEDALNVTGPVEGTDSVTITSGIHGKITEINVKEGDEVVAGETILAKIDTQELQSRLETARGNYELAIANKDEKIKNDQSSYNKAAQALNAAQNEYNRKAELVAAGASPQSELDSAANALNSARADMAQYRTKDGKLDPGESYDIQISNAKLEVERLEKQLEDATLIAPISGTVTRVFAKVGRFADQAVDNNPTLITIEKLDKLQLRLSVSEYSIGKVKLGQKVDISADMLGSENTVQGTVEKISPSGEERQGNSGERVIPVNVGIADGSGLISGINAKAKIVIQEKDDVYTVPIGAIGDDGNGQSMMQFIEETGDGKTGVIKAVPVETGIEGELNVELLEDSLKSLDTSKPLRYMSKYDPLIADGTMVDYMMLTMMPDAQSGAQSAPAQSQ
ncbi:hypothetical protein HMPREF9333_00704 [Johnsonella ignava ATCC 51276]|uniref:Multidrug resistance protein MdtA-like barrel-sandwich hybrid domain-containing protein n=1 Tax=Johnsonella ignava ATCC 51276 TaxID=679200 RepID=G5GGL4_9FIRM|nr:HlyD family efflux transporter periplasmic adaptor subunit [Johnsonella ignava]EHI56174.1 hypothetical protein HMPREF9333_00704 [Johnsonella ignava ATCC 51276]